VGDDLPAALYVSLGRIVRALRAENAGSIIGHGGLSVLVTLSNAGSLRIGALAEAEGVAAPSMTRTVNVLESEGLVARAPDPDDGRAQVVALTPAGSALLGSGEEAKLAALRRRLDALSHDERAALEAALPAFARLAEVVPV
jgi:DNA-binding MarR family transcriptional regulator